MDDALTLFGIQVSGIATMANIVGELPSGSITL
jgi:hypothetical protein